ncbi:hypothetical protein ACFQ0T_24195 [Kitasatospora gansuensis]
MLSTMQRHQLNVTTLLRHGATVHGRSEAVTWTGATARRTSYAATAARAARLAGRCARSAWTVTSGSPP